MAHKPEELQEVLHYTFKNPALLRIALTHTSYANESKVATTHNERLEFLGDSVLSVVVADYLFHQSGRPEGELTRMRASLVSEDALFQFAQEIQLGEYLRLGHGEDLGGGRSRPSVVSDAFEAVIAALYLDGGMEAARNFILPFITEGKTAEDDYKTRLQEVVQQDPSAVLKYEVTGETGPDHNKQFTVCVWRNGELLAETDLLAIADVARSEISAMKSDTAAYMQRNWWKWIVLIIVIVVLLFAGLYIWASIRRRIRRRQRIEQRRNALRERQRRERGIDPWEEDAP